MHFYIAILFRKRILIARQRIFPCYRFENVHRGVKAQIRKGNVEMHQVVSGGIKSNSYLFWTVSWI